MGTLRDADGQLVEGDAERVGLLKEMLFGEDLPQDINYVTPRGLD